MSPRLFLCFLMTKEQAGKSKTIINISLIRQANVFSEFSRKMLDQFFLTGGSLEDLTRVPSISRWDKLRSEKFNMDSSY